MKEKLTLITLFAMFIGVVFPIVQPVYPNSVEEQNSPPKFALLIGINTYSNGVKSLEGAENDVKLMRGMLGDLYGFQAKDIKQMLSSSQNSSDKPTQANILDAFDKFLLENARNYYKNNNLNSPDKGATIVFHYSGHGSHLTDLPKGEKGADGTNEEQDENDENEIYYLSDTNGNPLYNVCVRADDPNADEKIQTVVERFVRVDNVRTLGNESSELNKGLELKLVKLKTLKERPTSLSDIVEDGYLQTPQLQPKDYFSFEIINNTGNDLFPYIYSIGTDGSVTLLYEPKNDGDKLLNGKTLKTLAAKVAARAKPPYGTETFKVIAASEIFNGKLLEIPALAKGLRGGNPLQQILAQASTNTRNSDPISFEFSGWATTSVDVEIKEK